MVRAKHCAVEFARHFHNSRARRLDGHPGRRSSSAGISWMYDQSNPDSNLVDLVRASRPGHNWLTSRAIPWCLLPTLSYPLSVIYTFNLLEAEEREEREVRVERSGHLVDLMVSFGSGLLFQFSHSIRIIKVAAPLCPSSSTLQPFPSLPRLIARYLRDNCKIRREEFPLDLCRNCNVATGMNSRID